MTHDVRIDDRDGKCMAICSCGWISVPLWPEFGNRREAEDAAVKHREDAAREAGAS